VADPLADPMGDPLGSPVGDLMDVTSRIFRGQLCRTLLPMASGFSRGLSEGLTPELTSVLGERGAAALALKGALAAIAPPFPPSGL
jgi:hypothetical protein